MASLTIQHPRLLRMLEIGLPKIEREFDRASK
jgi:hypothetical protein